MSHKRFAAYAWGVVAYNLAVIAWGAYVRASGSGAGCGAHWPLCNGEVVPVAAGSKTLVEFAHRASSGLALVAVVLLVWWAWRAFARGHAVRRAAALSLVFIVFEALIGAGIVLFEYVAENRSLGRASWMAVHLVNTFLLLGALALTAWWAGGERGPLRLKGRGALSAILLSALAATVVLAMSGAVAALGDTLFPAGSRSLAEALKQDLSPGAHLLIRLRLTHPVIALVVGGFLLYVAAYVTREPRGAWVRRSAGALAASVFVQFLVGALNVALLAPVWLQIVHLLLADAAWLSLMLLAASALTSPVVAPEPPKGAALARAA
jgi:heme A synthase